MRKLCFANIDYKTHITDEGWQLQEGLRHAGWELVGHGYGDGCADVPTLMERHKPDIVLWADPRDWHHDVPGGVLNKDVAFTNYDAGLLSVNQRPRLSAVILKDAAASPDFQGKFAYDVKADALVVYYSLQSVDAASCWSHRYPKIRTTHSVDQKHFEGARYTEEMPRARGIVSGARNSKVYPLRERAIIEALDIGLMVAPHPGYYNRGSNTKEYIELLHRFKVSVACSSKYKFLLRKIIESALAGCYVVTDLGLDDIPASIAARVFRATANVDLKNMIDTLEADWTPWSWEERKPIIDMFGYKAQGLALDARLREMHAEITK